RPLPRRVAKRPAARPASRWQAPGRRCNRDRQRLANGHKAPQVVGALARELGGGLGAIATQVAVPPPAARGCWVALSFPGGQLPWKRRRPGLVSPSAACGGRKGLSA